MTPLFGASAWNTWLLALSILCFVGALALAGLSTLILSCLRTPVTPSERRQRRLLRGLLNIVIGGALLCGVVGLYVAL